MTEAEALALLVALLQSRIKLNVPASGKLSDMLPDGNEIVLPAQPPAPPEAEQLSALLTDQDRVVAPPSSICVGLVVKEFTKTLAGCKAVTEALLLTVPCEFVQLKVKV